MKTNKTQINQRSTKNNKKT